MQDNRIETNQFFESDDDSQVRRCVGVRVCQAYKQLYALLTWRSHDQREFQHCSVRLSPRGSGQAATHESHTVRPTSALLTAPIFCERDAQGRKKMKPTCSVSERFCSHINNLRGRFKACDEARGNVQCCGKAKQQGKILCSIT